MVLPLPLTPSPKISNGTMVTRNAAPTTAACIPNLICIPSASAHVVSKYEMMSPSTVLPALIHAETNGAHRSDILQANFLRQRIKYRERVVGSTK